MLTTKNPAGRLVVLTALGISLLWLVSGCSPSGPAALREGKQLIEEGRPGDAIPHLKLATDLLPTNATAWNYLGLAQHGAGDFTNALNSYTHALSLNPALAEAQFNLGCLYLENRQPDSARNAFTAFTLRRPQELNGWLKLGTAQLRSRDPAGAERSFTKALQLSTNQVEALNGWGLSLAQRNRTREAATQFQRALAQQSDYAPALLNLAVLEQTQLNNPAQALFHYRAYLALQPRQPSYDLAETAVAALAAQLAPKSVVTNAPAAPPPANTNPASKSTAPPLAVAPKPAGVTNVPATNRSAVSAPTEVVRLPAPAQIPESRDVVVNPPAKETSPVVPETRSAPVVTAPAVSTNAEPARRTFIQRMNPVSWFERDNKPEPKQPTTPLATASPSSNTPAPPAPRLVSAPATPTPAKPAALKFKRYSYTISAPAPGNRAEALPKFTEGLAAQRAGDLKTALTAYRTAVRRDPGFFEAQYNLGVAAYDAGQISLALTAYETALALRADSRDTRYNFALSLRAADYPVDAAEELKKLLAGSANESRVHFSLGNLYVQQLGQPKLARVHYQQLLALEPNHPQANTVRAWLTANPE